MKKKSTAKSNKQLTITSVPYKICMRFSSESQKRTFVRAHAPSLRRSIRTFGTLLLIMPPMPSSSFAILGGRASGFLTPRRLFLKGSYESASRPSKVNANTVCSSSSTFVRKYDTFESTSEVLPEVQLHNIYCTFEGILSRYLPSY